MKKKWKEQHLNVPDEVLQSMYQNILSGKLINFVFFEHRAYYAENPVIENLNK